MKNNLYKCFVFLLFFLGVEIVPVMAQMNVAGVVLSNEDGMPLIGASVLVMGTKIGTITNANGLFTLQNVPSTAKSLMVSYIGMKSQEVAIIRGVKMRIVLNSDSKVLAEVVVTALGITKEKKALGYSVQDVKSDELNKASQLNVANALQGKVSGVQISQAGGALGASQKIIIRGNSSFNDNDPLIIIDGIPMDGTADGKYNGDGRGWLDTGSGINDINPEDIENITILKGGSAALYGMRAGNGAILITTKKGNKDKTSITYDGSFTIDKIYHLPHYQNSYGQGKLGSEYYYNGLLAAGYVPAGTSYQDFAVGNFKGASYIGAGYSYVDGTGAGLNDGDDESWGPRLDIGLKIPQYNSPIVDGVRTATDWVSHPNNVKDFFCTGFSQTHNVSISNSTNKGSFRASVGYRYQKGTVPNVNEKKYNGALNTSYNFNKYVSVNASMNYSKTTSDNLMATGGSTLNPLYSIMQWFGRQVDTKDLKAHYKELDAKGNRYNWITAFHVNPYYEVYNNTNAYDRDRLISKASLFVKPLDCLKFEGRIGYDVYNDRVFQKVLYTTHTPKGWFLQTNTDHHELNADFIAYFNKQINDISVDALAGANYCDQNNHVTAEGATKANGLTLLGLYTMSNVVGTPYTYMWDSHIRSNSVYANASIGYKGQAFVELSARNDWSSTIKDSFFYPSISISWIPTETFSSLKSEILGYLKLRVNLARVGNATSAYMTDLYYRSPSPSTINGVTQYYKSTTLTDTNIKPEKIQTFEVGLEAALWSNRIKLDLAYYNKNTSNQIMTVQVPTSTGYLYQLVNAGKVNNKGLEISLSAHILKDVNGWNWTSTLNWSRDKSKVVSLAAGLDTYTIGQNYDVYNLAKVGEAWGTLYGPGLKTDDQGRVIIGTDGLPKVENMKKLGSISPDWLAGWNNEVSYKDFSFGFLLDYRKGGDFYSISQMWSSYTGILDYTAATKADGTNIRQTGVIAGKDVLCNRTCVTEDGTINATSTSAEKWFGNYYSNPELAVCDGSFLKLREIHLTYTLPKSWLTAVKCVSSAKLSLIGSNVAILWLSKSNQMKLDPESTLGSYESTVGFEETSCPPTRSIGIKLNLTF